MAKRVKFIWDLFIKDGWLVANLNGGMNRRLQIDHPDYKQNVGLLKADIDFWADASKTVINGKELLDI